MSDNDRMSRPEPERNGPRRDGWTQTGAESDGAAGNRPAPDATVDEVVAHAVRTGYKVVHENIRHGRHAADRFGAGTYGVRDVPDDLTKLGGRLVQLSRDLTATCFDLVGALLRDPTLHSALQRQDVPPPAATTQRSGTRAAAAASGDPVPVSFNIKSSKKATAEPAYLQHPDRPAPLALAGLFSPDPSLPPLRKVSFGPHADGKTVVVSIDIPDDQPPGSYSGVVCDGVTHKPLGTLTIHVAS